MKKLILIFTVLLISATAVIAQAPPVVYVSWNIDNCTCVPSTSADYFKVTISIYDDANGNEACSSITVYTADAGPEDIEIPVPCMLDYCKESYPNTPSFTVTATVWFYQIVPDPDAICCTGTISETANCHDFDPDDIFDPGLVVLN